MSRFTGLLKRTAARLDLPQPTKSHVLLEMAADLEDLFAAYRERGLDEEEAARRVEEKFDASDDALNELVRLHRSAFRRGMDRFSEQAQTPWEKLMLVVILLFVAAMTGKLLVFTAFFREASVFVWPAAVIGVVAVVIFLVKAHQFYIKKDHAMRRLRTGLPSLLLMACAGLFNGVFGFFLGMQLSMARIATDIEQANDYFTRWLVGSSVTMILSLLVAILAAVFWFVLMNKVKRMELAEAALLLEEPR
jgi:membrane protein YdbS with pleckstrin-like domain